MSATLAGAVTVTEVLARIRGFREGILARDQVLPTTAHRALYRFAHDVAPKPRQLSTLEWVATAPSPFAVEMALRDFRLFAAPHAERRTVARVEAAARVRLAELRGFVVGSGE